MPWAQPLILLPSTTGQHDAMVRQLIRIGYDRLNGFLAEGMDAWKRAGLPTQRTSRIDLEALKRLHRQPRQDGALQADHPSDEHIHCYQEGKLPPVCP